MAKNQVDDNLAFLSEMASIFKALGDPNRLRIVLCLLDSQGADLSVSEIVEKLGISQPLTSHHLKELRHAGIVRPERSGPFIHYRISSRSVAGILKEAAIFMEDCSRIDEISTIMIARVLQLK